MANGSDFHDFAMQFIIYNIVANNKSHRPLKRQSVRFTTQFRELGQVLPCFAESSLQLFGRGWTPVSQISCFRAKVSLSIVGKDDPPAQEIEPCRAWTI